MVMGTPQFDAATTLYWSIKAELRAHGSNLFLAGMLPILFVPIPGSKEEQLAPDILAAPVPDHPRMSYRVEREGLPPSFVLEVVSPESRRRDLEIKPERYERMGVREYALFAPETPDGRFLLRPPLQGYRLGRSGEYGRWEPDQAGRLYSEVLDLWLVVRNGELRAQRPDGSWLPTLEESEQARAAAEARARAEEAENARLRAELEAYRQQRR